MAAVEVTISGVLYDKLARTTRPVVLIGEATLTGLEIGGGPVYPPGGGSGGNPPGIWGGANEPFPGGGPIIPPDYGTWPPQRPPHPAHPIVIPPDKPVDPPTEPPIDPPTNPPNVEWSWCWNPNTGWIPAYVAGDKPHPIPPKK